MTFSDDNRIISGSSKESAADGQAIPAVSICIPAYENAEGVRRLLLSIVRQTMTDYEVILSDDSASDAVKTAAEETMREAGQLEKLRYFRNSAPSGAAANWNRAAERARAPYVKIMHHDDWFAEETALEEMVRELDLHPEADLYFCGTVQTQLQNASPAFPRSITEKQEKMLSEDIRSLYLENGIGAPSATLVRRDALLRHEIRYDERLSWLVDTDYYLQILEKNPHYVCSHRPLIAIGLSDEQLTNRCLNDPELMRGEYTIVYQKHGLEDSVSCQETLAQIYARYPKQGERKKKSSESSDAEIRGAVILPSGIMRRARRQERTRKFRAWIDTGDYLLEKLQRKLSPLGNLAFWLALLIEMVIVVVDKSDYTNPLEGQLFRVTFLLFAAKMVTVHRSWKERLWLLLFLLLGVVSWKMSGRNQILRIVTFVAACRGMDCRRVMKLIFWSSAAGSLLLAVLALTGVFGSVTLTGNIDGEITTRFCFGMGHPNSFHIMMAMLALMGVYLYGRKLKNWQYAVLLLLDVLLFALCRSMMGALAFTGAVLGAWYCYHEKSDRASGQETVPDQSGAPSRMSSKDNLLCWSLEGFFILGLVFTIIGAIWGRKPGWVRFIDDHFLTGRVASLWDSTFHDGTLSSWTLLGIRRNQNFFDLGWIRAIYWYGVIPAAIMIAVMFALLRAMRKRRDRMGFVLVIVACLFTVMEAHFISEYLGRNFILVLLAAYAPVIYGNQKDCGNG